MSWLPNRGDRVELVACRDNYTDLRPGATGTVTRVTEQPWESVGVSWDNGSSLALLPDEGDAWKVIS